jgi:peptidoglycan/xylan/chitin deacetylase (PgdA/CDA1 family)
MNEERTFSRRTLLGTGTLALSSLVGCLGTVAQTASDDAAQAAETTPADASPDPVCEPPAVRESDDPLVVDFDSREALACQGRLFDAFEDVSSWEAYAGSVAGDRLKAFDGEQSARLTASADDDRAWIARRFEEGIDLSDRDLSLAVHTGDGDTRVTQLRLQLLAPDRDNRVDMWHPVGGTTGWVRLDFGPTEVVGDPDLTAVREIRVQSWVGDDAAAFNVDALRTTPKLPEPAVVLTFDDIQSTQYETAFPIMQEYGFLGVAGAIPWLVGEEDRIDASELTEMRDAGWDIVSHPQLEGALPEYSAEKQEELIRSSKRWLVENGFEDGSRFVIWPLGRAAEETLDISAKYHYMGFLGGRCPSGYITGPQTVGRVNGDEVETTLDMLEIAKRSRQVVVVMYHTIGAGQDRISTADFERTMRRIDELNLPVVTASDLWEMQSMGM